MCYAYHTAARFDLGDFFVYVVGNGVAPVHKFLAVVDKQDVYKRQLLNRVAKMSGDEMKTYTRLLYSTVLNLSRSYPVSYTHLDVYKRQAGGGQSCCRSTP